MKNEILEVEKCIFETTETLETIKEPNASIIEFIDDLPIEDVPYSYMITNNHLFY